MGLNYSTSIYWPCQDFFGRPITVVPIVSQPGGSAYGNRAIWNERDLNVITDDLSVYQDHEVIIDIREAEYSILPMQGDHVIIPADGDVPAEGEFVITNRVRNGGGEMTLKLSAYTTPAITTLIGQSR
jgi:hypothetical protein